MAKIAIRTRWEEMGQDEEHGTVPDVRLDTKDNTVTFRGTVDGVSFEIAIELNTEEAHLLATHYTKQVAEVTSDPFPDVCVCKGLLGECTNCIWPDCETHHG